MPRTRPTLRCLIHDLKPAIPPLDRPLDEIVHPILAKAQDHFHESAADRRERIRAIDDEKLFKVKVRRWRGAVWVEPDLSWLVAAGWRESGSADDFYAALAAEGQAARARYNGSHKPPLSTDTYTSHLLHVEDDRLRYRLEAGVRIVRRMEGLIPNLVRQSLVDGVEHAADLATFGIGVQVRADHGHETYVAVRIVGSVPDDLTKVILDIVPGCEQDGWYPAAAMPERSLGANEQAWSNIMDPTIAAKLLHDAES